MEQLEPWILNAGLFILFLLILFIGKMVNDILTPYKVDVEMTHNDNPALAVSFACYLSGVAIVFAGALLGPEKALSEDLASTGLYALLGILLLNLSRFINDRLLLSRFDNVKEIIEDRNLGTGAVQGGAYLASAFMIAGAIHGDGGGPLSVLICYALGQVGLLLMGAIHQKCTCYDVHGEIEADNAAAGVSLGGGLTAAGIVLMQGLSGSIYSWSEHMVNFAQTLLALVIAYPSLRLFIDRVLLPGSKLNQEISRDRNIGAAYFESMLLISFSIVLTLILE